MIIIIIKKYEKNCGLRKVMKLTKGHDAITCQEEKGFFFSVPLTSAKSLPFSRRRWTSKWKITAMNFSTRLAEKLPGILPVPSHPLLRKGLSFFFVNPFHYVSLLWPHPGFVSFLVPFLFSEWMKIKVKHTCFMGFSSFVISIRKSAPLSETFVSESIMLSWRWQANEHSLLSRVLGAFPELRFFATANHNRRLRLGLQKNMVWSLQRAELSVVTSSCIVHPATEAYAHEAIEAIKSEKVIAVPTDTLYGFACDAW